MLIDLILSDLDELRDRRYNGTVDEEEYHAEQDRLWSSLRAAHHEEEAARNKQRSEEAARLKVERERKDKVKADESIRRGVLRGLDRTALGEYDTAAKSLRTTLGVKRLSPEQRAALERAVEVHRSRYGRRTPEPTPAVLRLAHQVGKRRVDLIRPIYERLYRTPSGRWVGGDVDLTVIASPTPMAAAETKTVWHRKHTWSGTDLEVTLHVQPDWRRAIHGQGLAEVDGKLVTHILDAAGPCRKVAYVEQGRGCQVRIETGWVVDGRLYADLKEWVGQDKAKSLPTSARRMLTSGEATAADAAMLRDLLLDLGLQK